MHLTEFQFSTDITVNYRGIKHKIQFSLIKALFSKSFVLSCWSTLTNTLTFPAPYVFPPPYVFSALDMLCVKGFHVYLFSYV